MKRSLVGGVSTVLWRKTLAEIRTTQIPRNAHLLLFRLHSPSPSCYAAIDPSTNALRSFSDIARKDEYSKRSSMRVSSPNSVWHRLSRRTGIGRTGSEHGADGRVRQEATGVAEHAAGLDSRK
ncbi:hypothetical protein BV25DRAFT_1437373 [Artomyces pyxidatus]|uniref:Uncharacterized protein n=1 Tax=Artomyces pyxidatus TaxID=48021 RepID=A0ACB8SM89_9AGAM|nr:hypothetical protein BV25DRAFT_1437373 [Artomyces pyxidatus]